jgi:hypothetical protein
MRCGRFGGKSKDESFAKDEGRFEKNDENLKQSSENRGKNDGSLNKRWENHTNFNSHLNLVDKPSISMKTVKNFSDSDEIFKSFLYFS